jgi:hypothetical protein
MCSCNGCLINHAIDIGTSDAKRIAASHLIMRLLAGSCVVDDQGRTVVQYPESNSYEERQARQALAMEVRLKMPGFTGELLAFALDPHTPSRYPGLSRAPRKISFESSSPGQASNWRRDLEMIQFIREERRKAQAVLDLAGRRSANGNPKRAPLSATIGKAAEQYGLDAKRVREIWDGRLEVPSAK